MIKFRPNTSDYLIFESINRLNEYRLPERFYADDIIIDVGAHIGCFAFACFFRGAGKVIAFEPDHENCHLASQFLVEYGARASIHRSAVWRSDNQKTGPLRHSGYPLVGDLIDTGGGDVLFQSTPEGSLQESNDCVHAVSLDQILREHEHVRLLKLACAGSEWPILFTSTLLNKVEAVCGTYKEIRCVQDSNSIPICARIDGYRQFTGNELRKFLQDHFDDVLIVPSEQPNAGHFFASRKPGSYLNERTKDIVLSPPLYSNEVPHYLKATSFYVFSSSVCCSNHFRLPLYAKWCEALGEKPRYHRKQWEYVYICQVLHERKKLTSGMTAIGFGVGREPLVSLFASRGVRVVASDIDTEKAKTLGWTSDNGQHIGDQLSALNKRLLCRPELFEQMVTFRTVDMNEIPADIGCYDFCWSSCAFEHLGSLRAGMDFVLNSSKLLNPGGIAVHTTEFNLSSNETTLEHESCVIYRRRDIESLTKELRDAGYVVETFDFYGGSEPVDKYVDIPPYTRSEPHLRLALGQHTATSIGIIIHRPPQKALS